MNHGRAGTAQTGLKHAQSDVAVEMQETHVSTQNRLCAVSLQPQATTRAVPDNRAAELTDTADNPAPSQKLIKVLGKLVSSRRSSAHKVLTFL